MSNIKELHKKAMDLAEMAFVANLKGDATQAQELFHKAFEYEAQAARLVPNIPSSEPSRSVLYRSAASLAIDCDEFQGAENLINEGLSGDPPEEIANELNILSEKLKICKEKNLTKITLALDPDFLEKIDRMAERLDLTRNQLMRNLLDSAYEDIRVLENVGLIQAFKFGTGLFEKSRQALRDALKDGKVRLKVTENGELCVE